MRTIVPALPLAAASSSMSDGDHDERYTCPKLRQRGDLLALSLSIDHYKPVHLPSVKPLQASIV